MGTAGHARGLGGFHSEGFERADQVVNYVVSHDERRPEHELQFWGAHIQPADKPDASQFANRAGNWACRRRGSGWSSLLTSPGVPMLLAGQEFGEDSPRTIEFWPLDWKKLILPEGGAASMSSYRRLCRLRHDHPALRSDYVEYYWDDFAANKIAALQAVGRREGRGRGCGQLRQPRTEGGPGLSP